MKFLNFIKENFTKQKITRTLNVIFALVIIFAVILPFVYKLGKKSVEVSNKEAELVDVRLLKSQLVESSELTTAKFNLTCYSEFKDTGIAILNRSDFIMIYDAIVRAGINLEDVQIKKADRTDKIIYITVPKATLQGEPSVDPKSIKYFDEHFAIFNVNEKEDANKAQALAQDNAKKQAMRSGLIEMADKQSEALVVGLLSKIAPADYKIEVLKEDITQ